MTNSLIRAKAASLYLELNLAEIEFSVFSLGCLRKRVPGEESLCGGIHALEQERNRTQATINRHFGIQAARTRPDRLNPINP